VRQVHRVYQVHKVYKDRGGCVEFKATRDHVGFVDYVEMLAPWVRLVPKVYKAFKVCKGRKAFWAPRVRLEWTVRKVSVVPQVQWEKLECRVFADRRARWGLQELLAGMVQTEPMVQTVSAWPGLPEQPVQQASEERPVPWEPRVRLVQPVQQVVASPSPSLIRVYRRWKRIHSPPRLHRVRRL
jgi:hypothetical protein